MHVKSCYYTGNEKALPYLTKTGNPSSYFSNLHHNYMNKAKSDNKRIFGEIETAVALTAMNSLES